MYSNILFDTRRLYSELIKMKTFRTAIGIKARARSEIKNIFAKCGK